MPKLTRRRFLEGSAVATLATPVLAGCGDDGGDGECPASPTSALWQHAVASGDPLADSVILWSRVTPQAGEAAVEVDWEIASDPCFEDLVGGGSFTTDADRDYTVKVDATGLDAGTTYYYRFLVGGVASPIGRTRTLPTGSLDRLRLAFTSCSNYPAGLFHAYRGIAERDDLDVVLHLGDYTYEYANAEYGDGTPIDRASTPDAETVSLSDYRTRLAQYRTDPDLQDAHRQHPWIVVWDDHETANNAWTGGAENHQPETEGDWDARKAVALQAYFEWLPIREPSSGNREEIYRAFAFGDLVELMMLETRLTGREEQIADAEGAAAPGRQLLGATQEGWLLDRLRSSTATWRLVGQQTIFTHFRVPGFQENFYDQWEGYQDARARLLDAIAADGVSNVVVLTGDVHSSWAAEVPVDPDADPTQNAAVEFVTPSVSAQAFGVAVGETLEIDMAAVETLLGTLVFGSNPHVRWADLFEHGYVLVDVTRDRVQADWYWVDDVRGTGFAERHAKSWAADAAEGRTGTLREVTTPTAPRPGPSPAP